MKVLKFGGTSVGSADAIRLVKDLVQKESETSKLIMVVSAFSQVTNKLEEVIAFSRSDQKKAREIIQDLEHTHFEVLKELTSIDKDEFLSEQFRNLNDVSNGIFLLQEVTKKSSDFIVTLGEVLSSYIVSSFFAKYFPTALFDSKKFLITSAKTYLGKIDFHESQRRFDQITKFEQVNVFPGFIATNPQGQVTSLGRGGSDYTASILANLANADELQIWTDVSGIMSADPKLVRQSRVLPHLSYEEALELSHFGAKVIYPPSIQPALNKGIPIKIKNTFKADESGTLITKEWDDKKTIIQGISSIKDIVLVNMNGAGMVGIPSFSYRFFKALAENQVNVILITQASSEHSICVAINKNEVGSAVDGIQAEFEDEIENGMINGIAIEEDLAIVALVGSNMKNQVGISGKLFHELGKNGISVKAIAQGSSERNISFIIPMKNLHKAVNVLHESFFLSERKRINLFVIGVGNVGKALLQQIGKQQSFLIRMQQLEIRLAGLANTRKMILDKDGIDLAHWKSLLENGVAYSPRDYMEQVLSMNLRNSVFVDITASEEISKLYGDFLSHNVSVVTPNKLAATSPYDDFKNLHDISVRNNVQFLYETNVAAGLPVLSTLKDLIRSGDRINKIQAVLSGTLNYLFNTYDGSVPFAEVLKDAQNKGLTEPDPRLDLFGSDVMRKILILSRECGHKMEFSEVAFESFLPDACHEASSVDEFYKVLKKNEDYFKKMAKNAKDHDQKLRVVASLDKGQAKVALEGVSGNHPFYHLEGKDNIVLFFTNRYVEQPLVVKGAGAGAEVTASGIFADILKISAE